VVEALRQGTDAAGPRWPSGSPGDAVGDDDLHLALYACYELHYRGFEGVDPDWEWHPGLIAFRTQLERRFLGALRDRLPARAVEPEQVGDELFRLAAEDPAPSLSRYLETRGSAEQFLEFVIQRSAYQLKEADPHTWAIPRLSGPPKAALVEIQADEYGSGRAERVHAELFATTMEALGLDRSYGAYLDRIPGHALAGVNLISLLGLHRRHRGALVGHLAMFEITSAVPNRRYGNALRRLGLATPQAVDFYDEHVEADSVHENIAAYDLAEGLARMVPDLTADVLFGARALLLVDRISAARMLDAWLEGRSSLRPAPGKRNVPALA
jgi:hypothetical protein